MVLKNPLAIMVIPVTIPALDIGANFIAHVKNVGKLFKGLITSCYIILTAIWCGYFPARIDNLLIYT